MRADLLRLLGMLRPQAGLLSTATLLAIAAAALELLPYWLLAQLALYAQSMAFAQLAALAGAFLLAALARLLCFGGANVASHAAAFRMQRQLRERLLLALQSKPLTQLQGRGGELKKTLIDDVASLESLIGHTLPDLIAGLAAPLLAALLLLWLDWRMALASLALLPLAGWAYRRSFRDLGPLLMRWHEADMAANGALLSHVRGIATLKAHGRVASSFETLRQSVHQLADLAAAVTRQTALPYALFFVALSTNLTVVLPAGIWLVAQGSLSTASLLIFVTLGAGLTAPLLRVLNAFGSLQKQIMGLRRIDALLAANIGPAPARTAAPRHAAIRLRGLCAGHAGGPDVLHELDLDIPAQGYTAIVGPSGAGKSSLLGVLTGALELRGGQACLGGVPLDGIPAAERPRWLSCVFQHTLVFAGSLRDNLIIARPEASDADLDAALTAAGLPGYRLDQAITEGGSSLSGGERQRLAIARALLTGSAILLLDEATSAADPQTERAIMRDMRVLARQRSIIAVTHRLEQARLADRIVVLAQGRLAGIGRHEDLLQTCPVYQTLWQAQARSQAWTLT